MGLYTIKAGDTEENLPIANEKVTIRKPKYLSWCDGCQSYQFNCDHGFAQDEPQLCPECRAV